MFYAFRFLFIHEKKDKFFFMHSSMQSHLKNQKNMVLMYSPMLSHTKKNKKK